MNIIAYGGAVFAVVVVAEDGEVGTATDGDLR